jgi:NifU-like protein involved in Fe-S cluster formation
VNGDPLGDLLEPQVRQLFANLQHAGNASSTCDEPLDLPDGQLVMGEAGREQRGTRVRFVLKLRDSQLIEARYYAYGCPHTLAVCEWLARRLEAEGAQALGTPTDWCRSLRIPIVKLGRLLIVEDALKAALARVAHRQYGGGENVVK